MLKPKTVSLILTDEFTKAIFDDQENKNVVALLKIMEDHGAGIEHTKTNLKVIKAKSSPAPDFVAFADKYIDECPNGLFWVNFFSKKTDESALKTALQNSSFKDQILEIK